MLSRLRWFTAYGSRKLEWITALHIIVTGLFLLLPPITLQGSSGLAKLGKVMPEPVWGVTFLAIGCANAYSLHINGRASWTPFVRLAVMTMAVAIFAYIARAFVVVSPWSWGTLNFLSLAFFFCGNGVLAAARDAGREVSRWRHGRRGGD